MDSTDRPDTSQLPPVQSPESSTISPISSKPEISSSTQQTVTSISYLPPVSSTYPSSTMQVNESVSYLPPVTQITTSISYLPPSSTATTDAMSGSTSESVSYLPPSTSTSADTRPITSTFPSSISSTVSSPQTGKYECTEEGFFPNPSNCKKFYRCVQGQSGYQKYEFECAPGTAWDQSVQTCNYVEQVASCSIENNEIDHGSISSTSNPVSGSFVTSSSTSSAPSQITATTSSSAVPIPTTDASIPETSTELSMPEGDKTEASSTITNAGEKPVLGKPEEIQMPGSSSTENSSESSSEQSSSESSEESSSSTESHVSDCTTQKLNNTIVCNEEGFHPHPIRCDKFYRCVDNGNGFNVYHFDCPPGTIFDPSINVCNYPESVYPARDCTTGSTTLSNANVELTTESETSEQSVSTTTVQSTTQTEESTIISVESSSTSSSTETLEESTTTSSIESTTVEISENIENMTESTAESITAITEDATDSSTERTEATASTELTSETPTTESQESTTEQSTTESSNTEGQEQSTTESQEQSTIESQETQSTTESQEQSTTELSELTTAEPTAATPCTIGNLTDDQIILVCPTGFRRHPKYCNLFYQCTSEGNMEIKILVLSCPENTIFDEKKIQCLPADRSSDPCTGAKASVRLYRRLENNALLPVSNPNQIIDL